MRNVSGLRCLGVNGRGGGERRFSLTRGEPEGGNAHIPGVQALKNAKAFTQ